MTVKTESKGAATQPKREASKQEDLEIAYEVHTLAQMVYFQIASTNPWVTPVSPLASFQMPTAWTPPVAEERPPWVAPAPWPW